jgi:hypothetical protein
MPKKQIVPPDRIKAGYTRASWYGSAFVALVLVVALIIYLANR